MSETFWNLQGRFPAVSGTVPKSILVPSLSIAFRAGDLEELCKVNNLHTVFFRQQSRLSRVVKSEKKAAFWFEKHLKAVNAEVHRRFFYSSYRLFIVCVVSFFIYFVCLFINLQYFQVRACVLAHGSYTLAKKPFDKAAVYNDLSS